jgi:hypothetical protein
MLRFADLYNQAMSLYDTQGDTDTDLTITKDAINRAHARRASETGWAWLLSPKCTLQIVAGQTQYILPFENIGQIQYWYNETTKQFIPVVPDREFISESFDATATSNQLGVVMAGTSPVKRQPTTAQLLSVTSTAEETGFQSVYIEGTDSDGNVVSDTIGNINTSVSANTPIVGMVAFASVTRVTVEGVWTGTLTLKAVDDDATLVVLTPTSLSKQYQVIELVNAPSEHATVTYRYYRRPRQLVRDNDVPEIPYPYSTILVYDALIEMATYSELDSESIGVWRDQQQRWADNLALSLMEGNVVGGQTERLHEGV